MKRTSIQIRCTEEQKSIIEDKMRAAGFSNLSEYCRVKLIEGTGPITRDDIKDAIDNVPKKPKFF